MTFALQMSAYDGGLNRSTQHFILEGKMECIARDQRFRRDFASGREGGAVKSLWCRRGVAQNELQRRLVSRHLPFIAKQPCMGGDLTQVLRRPVETTTQSGQTSQRRRVDQERSFGDAHMMMPSAAKLAPIPIVDVRNDGPVRHATEGRRAHGRCALQMC